MQSCIRTGILLHVFGLASCILSEVGFAQLTNSNNSSSSVTAADEVLTRVRDAVCQVYSLKTSLEIPFSDAEPIPSDAEFDHLGRPTFAFVQVWWDSKQRVRVEMRKWERPAMRKGASGPVYEQIVYTLDGDFYRGLNSTSKRAKIERQANVGMPYCTPVDLLGNSMNGLDQNIFEYLLSQDQFAYTVEAMEDGLWRINAEYDPPDGSYRRLISIIADPAQDYLPVTIITRFKWTGTVDQQISVTETRVIAGVRIPTRGTLSAFSIHETYPDGLTLGEVNAMDKDTYFRDVEPRVKREERLIGTREVSFPVETLSVNDIYPESFFHLEIPSDYDIADFTVNATVAKTGAKTERSSDGSSHSQPPAIAATESGFPQSGFQSTRLGWVLFWGIGNLVLIASVWYFRRWQKYDKVGK